MAKYKLKQTAAASSFDRSLFLDECKTGQAKNIISRYEDLNQQEEVPSVRRSRKSANDKIERKCKRSKSLTSMRSQRHRKNIPQFSNTENIEHHPIGYSRTSLQGVLSVDTNVKLPLKPILKQGNGWQAKPGRDGNRLKVSISDVEDDTDYRFRQLSGKNKNRKFPSKEHSAVKAMTDTDTSLESTTKPGSHVDISIASNYTLYDSSTSTISTLPHGDANGNFNKYKIEIDDFCEAHYAESSGQVEEQAGSWHSSESRLAEPTKSSTKHYREIWIGRLPEPTPSTSLPCSLLSAHSTSSTITTPTSDGVIPGSDLIDLSSEVTPPLSTQAVGSKTVSLLDDLASANENMIPLQDDKNQTLAHQLDEDLFIRKLLCAEKDDSCNTAANINNQFAFSPGIRQSGCFLQLSDNIGKECEVRVLSDGNKDSLIDGRAELLNDNSEDCKQNSATFNTNNANLVLSATVDDSGLNFENSVSDRPLELHSSDNNQLIVSQSLQLPKIDGRKDMGKSTPLSSQEKVVQPPSTFEEGITVGMSLKSLSAAPNQLVNNTTDIVDLDIANDATSISPFSKQLDRPLESNRDISERRNPLPLKQRTYDANNALQVALSRVMQDVEAITNINSSFPCLENLEGSHSDPPTPDRASSSLSSVSSFSQSSLPFNGCVDETNPRSVFTSDEHIFENPPILNQSTETSVLETSEAWSFSMRRSLSTSFIDDEEPLEVKASTTWFIPPPAKEKPKFNYSTLPKLQLPARPHQKPQLNLSDGVVDQLSDTEDLKHSEVDHSVELSKTQSLSRAMTSSKLQYKRRGSFTERLNKIFSRKNRNSKEMAPQLDNIIDESVTVSELYSDWLEKPDHHQTIGKKQGEGVRTVVLSRTKKGYGFVLRGAKAEQLKKLNVEFIPSEKMPALQYLDSVEKGSVSDKAGLRAGDFLLEIDGKNVATCSHEETVECIKRAGDVLPMKVIRAVVTQEGSSKSAANGSINGALTLPHRKPERVDDGKGSSSEVLGRRNIVGSSNGQPSEEEKLAIDVHCISDQLDATLANYDSDSRSSSSGAVIPTGVTFRDQKTASIRQRPSSSHFNSIQELDDMFIAPPPFTQSSTHSASPPSLSKSESRKPAKSRVKKFWNKGKTNSKLNADNKPLSLSQPNLAALDRDTEVKPITMYEMSIGHSLEESQRGSSIPRTYSGDLAIAKKKHENPILSTLPPPPVYPAPAAPEEDKVSQVSNTSTGSRNGPHHAQITSTNQHSEGHHFLPRTPLPFSEQTNIPAASHESVITVDSGTLQRSKLPPPPPLRSFSHESGVILTMQGTIQSAATGASTNQSNASNKPANQTSANTSSFSDALKRAVAEREDKSANNMTNDTTKDGDVYAVVRKGSAATTTAPTTSVTSAPSVEDQLRLAVARRRTLIERQEPSSESEKSSSVTPELITSPTINSAGKSDNKNFRELAEQKRLEFLKKKSDSKEKLLPPPPVISQSESLKANESLEAGDEEDNSMSELQKIMSRLSVAKGEEPNNNVKKKPPPLVMKKPSKVQQPTSTQDHLSPVEEFPPPPPPHDFSSTANDILIPPPTFEIPPQIAALSPPIASVSSNSKNEGSHSHPSHHGLHTTHQNHDVDNHSVTSSVGSDTISSVSQDGNRLSVATSGYSSDPSRSNKISISGKNVELWSTGEVGVWLDAIGLGEYKAVFAENCIEGETLISLSKADVKELGVEKVGHRVKLDKEIRKLIAESNA